MLSRGQPAFTCICSVEQHVKSRQGTWHIAVLMDRLPAAPLQGTLPASWGALGNLTQLNLINNSMVGPLPSNWSGLVKVISLQVTTNRLTGTVTQQFRAAGVQVQLSHLLG
jgi:hypothetical protein